MGIRPVPEQYPKTQNYRDDFTQYNLGKGHGAIDFGCPEGVAVVAVEDGTVILAGNSAHFPGAPDASATHADYVSRLYFLKGSGGNVLGLDHGGYVSTYSHLSKLLVLHGQRVRKGQVIALSGYSGTVQPPGPRGSHLHFEILAKPYQWGNGYFGRVDPAPYITEPYRKTTSQEAQPVAKAYRHDTKWTTKNQVARSFYGFGPKPTGVTIHHWGDHGQKFDNVCHFLATNNTPTSAHTVIQDGRIATLAVPEVATYHAGHTVGNGTTIGVECRPECTPGDVDTVVQYIYELETVYGSLNIYQHKHWFPTACAGKWGAKLPEIIDRVNAMHKNGGRDPKLSSGAKAPAPKPVVTTQSAPAKPAPAKEKPLSETNPTGWNAWRYRNPKIEKRDAYQILRDIDRKQDEILTALKEK